MGDISIIETYPNARQVLLEMFPSIFLTDYRDENMQNKYYTFYDDVKNKIKNNSVLIFYQLWYKICEYIGN